MTNGRSLKNQRRNNQLKEALAVLISCTHTRNRPLALTEIAQWLEVAVRKLGSYASVADRVGLTPKMLRQFSYVLKLSYPVKELFQSRKLDSVDVAVHLAKLPPNEQEVVAEALAAGEIDTTDVRAVVQLRLQQQKDPTKKLIQRVKESKTKQEYVFEFVIRGSHDRKSIINAFKKYIQLGDIVRLEIEGSLGRLVLTPKGKQALFKAARNLGSSIKQIIPAILSGEKGR